ncbi:glycerate kinase [Flavobacteriaceae bacterium SZ-1-7]|uniref:glycerate kinase n=1 Tax=Tamlana sedimenti TaxID=3134126 RepID=UPI003127E9FF
MKIVVAPDKFKNSLTGWHFCNAVEEGIHAINPDVELIKLPLADGGDGTMDVLKHHLNGELVRIEVNNPFFNPTLATYLYAEKSKTAFIEMAEASGMKLLKPEQLDCKNATTFGTGEMIVDAINKGAWKIILGIGGSATNDCGIGMATALGYRFLDKNKRTVKPIGVNLAKIESIDVTYVHPKLNEVAFEIACDVENPLYGKDGAAFVYAAQKGATVDDIIILDSGLRHLSKIIEEIFNVNPQNVKGAGAAGGMGIASKVFLNGELQPGIQLIRRVVKFDEKIKNADWIITGEGTLDKQTLSGKTVHGVVTSTKAKNIKVAALCGDLKLSEKELKNFGIDYADWVLRHAKDLNDALENSYDYVKKMATEFAKKVLL